MPAKRLPVDSWYWQLVVQACGSRCCACGKHQSELADPLERGHIKLHTEHGDTEPENILPVCRPCNKKYTKSDTPFDYLNTDWRERLAGLLLLRLNPKYHVGMVSGHSNMVLTVNPTEKTALIDWKTCDFGLPTDVYTWSSQHGRMTPHEQQRVVDELLRQARQWPTPPSLPNPRRQEQMRQLVREHGEQVFLSVGRLYLQKQSWLNAGYIAPDSWAQFCDGFRYLKDEWVERDAAERKLAEREREQRDEQKRSELRHKIETVRAIPAIDTDLIAELDKYADPGALPAELLERCYAAIRGHAQYKQKEEDAKKRFEGLRQMLFDDMKKLPKGDYRALRTDLWNAKTDEQLSAIAERIESLMPQSTTGDEDGSGPEALFGPGDF
jgi:hypothetical protein